MEKGKEMVKPCVPKMEKNNNDKEVKCVTIPAGAIPTPTFGGDFKLVAYTLAMMVLLLK